MKWAKEKENTFWNLSHITWAVGIFVSSIETIIILIIFPSFNTPIDPTSIQYLFSSTAQAIATAFALLVAILSFKQTQLLKSAADLTKELDSLLYPGLFTQLISLHESIGSDQAIVHDPVKRGAFLLKMMPPEDIICKDVQSLLNRIYISRGIWHAPAKRKFFTLSIFAFLAIILSLLFLPFVPFLSSHFSLGLIAILIILILASMTLILTISYSLWALFFNATL